MNKRFLLPDRESNPGLPRDRRRSSPLDYRGLLGKQDHSKLQSILCYMRYKKKYNPSSRIWTSDLWISAIANYSPPLYQLSYRRCYNNDWKGLGLLIVKQGRHASDIYRDTCTNFLVWPVLYNIYLNSSKVSPPFISGGVAQMVERSLSMREVPGSIPGASIPFHFIICFAFLFLHFLVSFHPIYSKIQQKSWQAKGCIVRESNPGRPRGRRAFYHWTNDAYTMFLTRQDRNQKCPFS